MNVRLTALYARRTASAKAVLGIVGVLLVAALLRRSANEPVSDALAFDHARALWSVALVMLGGIALWSGASIPHRWFTGEGEWLGAAPLSRYSIATSALVGTLLGLVVLGVAATVTISLVSRTPDRPMELALIGGSEQSFLLLEGESFEQVLERHYVSVPDEALVRIRVTPTIGGLGPTTFVRASAGGPTIERPVARRTWIEVPHHAGAVSLENLGPGALAVLGPWPVEAWRPSTARLGGHARVLMHCAALLCLLLALSFGAGAWMSPGIAALLAFSLWLSTGTPGLIPQRMGHEFTGATSLGRVLDAIGEGRVPAQLSLIHSGVACAALVIAILVATPALGTWYRENRA